MKTSRRLTMGAALVGAAALALGASRIAVADSNLYVDPQIAEAVTSSYDPATRKATGGSSKAFKNVSAAAIAAEAGQTVILRGGEYREALAPKNSGAEGKYITFKAQAGEDAVFTGKDLSPALVLDGRSYVAIEGLKFVRVRRWMLACKTHHCVLKGNTFSQALDEGGSAKTGLFFEEATYNRVVDNIIDDTTQDNLALIKSDRNLIEGNVFTKAKHVLWTVKGGNYNVIRRNYLHNQIQKIGEVYDCAHVGSEHQFTQENCTKHNLVEWNVFAHTASSGDHSPYAGIQYAAQEGLIRRNVFYDCIGPALDLTLYPEEARFNTNNRICHNVFYKNHYCGIALAGRKDDKYTFEGNELKNNILLKTTFVRNDKRWEWFKELDGKSVQIFLGGSQGYVFDHNMLFGGTAGEKYLIVQGSRDSKSNPPAQDLAWWKSNRAEVMKDLLEADPQFADPDKRDFHLKAGSPAIDAGAFLTQTKDAGEGAALPVLDARWFFDGYGIEGLEGDEVQIQGQAKAVKIVKVDFEKNILTLAEPLKWTAGQGVALAFSGKAPDLGVFENGAKEPKVAPAAPAGLEK